GGSAVAAACDELVSAAREVASERLGARAEFRSGRFFTADRALLWEDLGELSASGRFESAQTFSSGAYAAAVEGERATGRVIVRKLVAVDDAGRIVNPLLARGQTLGAVVQGLGAVLSEVIVHDARGRLVAPLEYGLLTAAEVPEVSGEF